MSYPTFKPALRIVNSTGGVIAGPLNLYQPNAQGIVCDASVEYVPELLGPWLNLAYQQRWKLLGYRPRVTLDFPLLVVDGASAGALLYQYYVAGMGSETYAGLQFNLYSVASTAWRGMIPVTPWNPRHVKGRQRIGWELALTLEARDLISAPGDWTAQTW